MEEIFDIYTRDGKYLGKKEKSICHSKNPGFYHKPVWIWIINSNGEILVQKRAACKNNHPNKWDMPSAGHVIAGERPIEGAIRETFEELGVKTKENDYKFICEYIADSSFEIAQVYLLHLDLEINEFKLQAEEVAEVKWLKFDEFKELFYSDDFVRFDDEYRKLIIQMLKDSLGNLIMDDEKYIDIAIDISKNAKYPYGAIVVKDGQIVGRSDDNTLIEKSMYSHAELEAIESASKNKNLYGDLRGATLYVSCEPCMMCMGAILYEEFSRVVYAATLQDSSDNYCPEIITDIDSLAKYSKDNIEIVRELHRDKAIKILKNASFK